MLLEEGVSSKKWVHFFFFPRRKWNRPSPSVLLLLPEMAIITAAFLCLRGMGAPEAQSPRNWDPGKTELTLLQDSSQPNKTRQSKSGSPVAQRVPYLLCWAQDRPCT